MALTILYNIKKKTKSNFSELLKFIFLRGINNVRYENNIKPACEFGSSGLNLVFDGG